MNKLQRSLANSRSEAVRIYYQRKELKKKDKEIERLNNIIKQKDNIINKLDKALDYLENKFTQGLNYSEWTDGYNECINKHKNNLQNILKRDVLYDIHELKEGKYE